MDNNTETYHFSVSNIQKNQMQFTVKWFIIEKKKTV